jgi:hypothetical protein
LTKSIQTIGLAAHNSKTKLDLPPIKVEGEVDSATLKEEALTLGFVLGTPAKDGFVKVQFNASVRAFGNGAAPSAGTDERGHAWRIENGFNAGLLDAGGDSMGQNILLLVGDLTAGDYVDIIGNGEWGPPPPIFYVGTGGLDTSDGLSEATRLLTLAAAYTAAVASERDATIILTSNLSAAGAVTFGAAQIETITVKGMDGAPKPTISRSTSLGGILADGNENEAVLKVTGGAKVEFQNIKINGIVSDSVYNRALFIDGAATEVTIGDGAVVTGRLNVNSEVSYAGGGVKMFTGVLTLKDGGAISDSLSANRSGGVSIDGGTFNMTGGFISNNTTTQRGGGVVIESGTFNMSGGEISENSSTNNIGGGVILHGGIFNMSGGVIHRNKATHGGGVNVGGVFNMSGGVISGNQSTHASQASGGGVEVSSSAGVFAMTGGIVYGKDAIGTLRNTITDASATAGGKAAVYAPYGIFTINSVSSTGTDDTINLPY